MNERITELAEKAERLAEDELAHLERVHNRLYSFTDGREIYNQKFAELIVRECMNLVKDCYAEPQSGQSPHQTVCASTIIEEHFGVEE